MTTPRLLCLAIPIYSCALAQQPQSSGQISGTVTDSMSGSPVIAAAVTLSGTQLGVITDDEGFTLFDVPPGSYTLNVIRLGYNRVSLPNVVVRQGESTRVKVQMVETDILQGEVTVTAKRYPDLREIPVSTRMLPAVEIRQTAGAFDDVARTVYGLPGIAYTEADRNDLIVRGGAPTENLFLVDNLEVPNINHFGTEGATGGSVSFINLDYVDRTSFSSGGFGVEYGDKLSSVMAINLKDGRSDRLHAGATLSSNEAGAELEGPLGTGDSYLLSVRRSYLEPIFRYYNFSFAPYYWDYLGKAVYQLGPRDNLEILAIGAIDRMTLFEDTDNLRQQNLHTIFGDQDDDSGGLTWLHEGAGWQVSTTASRNYGRFHYWQVGDTYNPHFDNASRESENALSTKFTAQLASSTVLSLGAAVKGGSIQGSAIDSTIPTGFTEAPKLVGVRLNASLDGWKVSDFVQIEQTIGDLKITGGVRGDRFDRISDGTVFGPRVSASYNVAPSTRLTAAAGRFYQSPSYIWIVWDSLSHNRSLTHMRMDQYTAGIEHFLSHDLSVNVEVYDKQYSQYPVSFTRPYLVMANSSVEAQGVAEVYTSLGLDLLESRGTGDARGLEVFIQKRLSESPYYARIGVTYSEANFTALDGVERPSSSDQRWKVNASAGYLFGDEWELTSTFRLATGSPYTPFGAANVWSRSDSLYNTQRLGVNHSLDMRCARRWDWGEASLTAYVDIQNIYNRKPIEPPIWNQTTNTPENPPTLGIVPSIGLRVEW